MRTLLWLLTSAALVAQVNVPYERIRDDSGRSYSFWKTDVAKVDKQRGKSPMPSYKGQLSDDELTDLVAYLASLKEEK